MIDEFKAWIKEYCWPVTQANSNRQYEDAQRLLEVAKANLPDESCQPLEWEGYRIALEWHQYTVTRTFSAVEDQQQICQDFEALLSQPCRTQFGEQHRLKSLLCVRLDSDSEGVSSISRREIDEFLEQVEDGDKNIMIWHHITPWAFEHRDLELSARAVEVLLHNRRIARQAVSFRRAEMLHAILAGTSTYEMIETYIEFIKDLGVREEFLNKILPVAREAGLVSEPQFQQLTQSCKADVETGSLA